MVKQQWTWLQLFAFSILCHSSLEVSLSGSAGLYTNEDKILILNNTNFQSSICSSTKAWIVEFYSSWCGHCIHFAPTFKEFAADVHAWRDVISVAAIDCAQDENMPTCREYEVMGYPTLKFFTPNTPTGDMGIERHSRVKTVPAIKVDMIQFIQELQRNKSEKVGSKWPNLLPAQFSGAEIRDTWNKNVHLALLLFEEPNSTLGSEVILDLSSTFLKLKVPLVMVRVEINSESRLLLDKLNVKSTSIVAVSEGYKTSEQVLASNVSRSAWGTAIKDFIWKKSSELALIDSVKQDIGQNKANVDNGVANKAIKSEKVASRKEVLNRRYKVFMSDLEKALFYSISHEVAQHSAIAGQTLQSLQQYATVLEKYFPGRHEMKLFLRDFHSWVHMHQDTVRGEDLSSWIETYKNKYKLHPINEWTGCKGSAPQYGGYPCGLWSLWHTLTISQSNLARGDPKEVMEAMKSFIHEFFGCRECARHFSQAIEDGKVFSDINNYSDAVLLLWKLHNKANTRLVGDISEDPTFPKLVFPSKEYCSACYLPLTGSNLWDEFDKTKVMEFLKNLYSKEKLNNLGLQIDVQESALVEAPLAQTDEDERLDVSNFRKSENSSGFIFFNGADISICLLVWFISAILLVVIYLKFISRKKFSNTAFFNNIKRKTSMNPLIGKV